MKEVIFVALVVDYKGDDLSVIMWDLDMMRWCGMVYSKKEVIIRRM